MKPEEYFKGLLNRDGRTVPEEHKPYFDKKLNDVKVKYQESNIASPAEVEQRIKDKHAVPTPKTTEQKVSTLKEKYKHLLMPKT